MVTHIDGRPLNSGQRKLKAINRIYPAYVNQKGAPFVNAKNKQIIEPLPKEVGTIKVICRSIGGNPIIYKDNESIKTFSNSIELNYKELIGINTNGESLILENKSGTLSKVFYLDDNDNEKEINLEYPYFEINYAENQKRIKFIFPDNTSFITDIIKKTEKDIETELIYNGSTTPISIDQSINDKASIYDLNSGTSKSIVDNKILITICQASITEDGNIIKRDNPVSKNDSFYIKFPNIYTCLFKDYIYNSVRIKEEITKDDNNLIIKFNPTVDNDDFQYNELLYLHDGNEIIPYRLFIASRKAESELDNLYITINDGSSYIQAENIQIEYNNNILPIIKGTCSMLPLETKNITLNSIPVSDIIFKSDTKVICIGRTSQTNFIEAVVEISKSESPTEP